MRDVLTDEQVNIEIDKLSHSDAVKLAKKEQRIKYKRRQVMYTLRSLEKRGKRLMEEGYTLDNITDRMMGDVELWEKEED